ncbi:polysaccharide biosynthesis protein [Sphingomonas koreensis]|nr:polysaccharide biosynthesis protein [Sphingomonas koreensis]
MGDLIEQWAVGPIIAFIGLLPDLDRRTKRGIVVAIDAALCVVSVWVAFSLRLGAWDLLSKGIDLLAVSALGLWFAIAFSSGVYRAIFRSVGSGTMVSLAGSVVLMALPIIAVFMVIGVPGVPRTIAIIQPMIFFLLLTLSRIVARYLIVDLLNQRNFTGEEHRTIIYGAGSAGQQLASSIRLEPGMTLLGFVDDDRRLHGHRLDRLTISHSHQLGDLITRHRITDVLIALPSISRARRKRIVDGLQRFNVHVRMLPAMREIVDGRVSMTDLREVEIEDMLGRDPVAPHPELLGRTITGKVVMVTGAGGSIGSELCRQIALLGPTHLVLVENYEFGLYSIEQEISEINGAVRGVDSQTITIVPELVNVTEPDAILRVMERWRPDTVFHAAAYKHVPLVEANIVSGARNNIFGTLHTAIAADRVSVRNFILISTDKAVRPTNVMGATKRVCELVLQAFAASGSSTVFAMVRFGNVLGSSGSVVPLFKRQIRNGGPVTVTDKRITRFFMTIPEAAQLVIQAGGMAEGGEVYVLDMGQAVKIVDFARTMIRLSGMSVRDAENPDGDIEIVEMGLRPGEKLYEELLIGNDSKPTAHQRIMQAKESLLMFDDLSKLLDRLDAALARGDASMVSNILRTLVPEYRPTENYSRNEGNRAEETNVAALPKQSASDEAVIIAPFGRRAQV